MNVLSLFDGMSCGQIALRQLGIPINKYYAAEIDPYAMRVTQNNFPETIHLGDVTKVKGEDLEKIDLLLGGSPCQGFSFAGKQLNFDDPRSALFFEFVRLLKECNPKYFLLENVRMKKEYQDVITEHLGVEPITINSALVSAQNRVRLYWTNIPNITQPEDRGVLLKDILEYDAPNEYEEPYVKLNGKEEGCVGYVGKQPKQATRIYDSNNKSQCLTALGGGQGGKTGLYQIPDLSKYELSDAKVDRVLNSPRGKGYFYDPETHDKIGTVIAGYHKEPTDGSYIKCAAFRGRYEEDGSIKQKLEIRKDDKTNTLTSVQKDNVIVYDNEQPHKESTKEKRDNSTEKILATQMGNSLRFDNVVNEHKAMTLRANNPNGIINKEQYYYRKLTPLECERLQTVPDGYTEGVSNTQRYKMLGNGWTVEVIKHIFKNMFAKRFN